MSRVHWTLGPLFVAPLFGRYMLNMPPTHGPCKVCGSNCWCVQRIVGDSEHLNRWTEFADWRKEAIADREVKLQLSNV